MINVPVLWPSKLTPSDEVEGVKNLYAHLTGLKYSVEAWEAGLLLYQFSKRPSLSISHNVARRWRFIASNDCILELYHLRARMGKIQSAQLRKCPSLLAEINMHNLKSARKMLDEYFPNIECLRHATAHKGENEAHPEEHAPDNLFMLSGFDDADNFSTFYKGKKCSLGITNQSLEQIKLVVVKFLTSFNALAAKLETQGHLD